MPLRPFFDQDGNKHVLCVTGGLTGIGKAIAIEFLSHGASVCVSYLPGHNGDDDSLIGVWRREALAAIHARDRSTSIQDGDQIPAIFVAGDVAEPQTGPIMITECVQTFGRVDTLVSNAGICRFEDFLQITPESWQQHSSVNLSGAFYVVQAAARQMATQTPRGGSIIGISSISALVGGAQQCHYTPTKAGINSLMQSCAAALGRYNIRCNALLPGTIRTQLNDSDLADGSSKKVHMEGRIPLGRLGEGHDLAGPALFLAIGELSGYVSGASLLVDGGAFVNFQ